MNKQLHTEYELEVVAREESADGVVALDLQRPDGAPLPDWTAGAHIDLVLDEDVVRQYSLVELGNNETCWRIGVLNVHDGRGGSRRIHESLTIGTIVRARGPRNHFALEPAQKYIFIAGGIGITPITGMIVEAERRGVPWTLAYGGRSRSSMAFADCLEGQFGDRVDIVPEDERGFIDFKTLLEKPDQNTLIYCCGPEPLLNAVERASEEWPAGAMHFERFVPFETGDAKPNEAFEVEFAVSGVVLEVPADKSILQVADEAGIDVLSSCAEGTCGTCETYIVSGEVEHRDSVLSAEEKAANKSMMICVSRAACPRLVLEL
ncbi:oxidoreductase [Cedecea colo]|uniref:Oxidoreductase n=2 Tax=Cedecea colo TaxID=2552946 RepID=A0ABX0VP17_9ENTR|nr:oxidoreductase [Cedecea colo]